MAAANRIDLPTTIGVGLITIMTGYMAIASWWDTVGHRMTWLALVAAALGILALFVGLLVRPSRSQSWTAIAGLLVLAAVFGLIWRFGHLNNCGLGTAIVFTIAIGATVVIAAVAAIVRACRRS